MTIRHPFKFTIIFLLNLSILLTLATNLAFAQNHPSFPIKKLRIQQERYSNDGVLVSRPHPADRRISNLFNINKIRSLEDYSLWLKQNIEFKKDGPHDTWSTPTETLNNRHGDCEDYTFLNFKVARMLGYEPKFLAFVRPNRAHAICIFQAKDHYVWFDNTQMHKAKLKSFHDFAQYISHKFNYPRVLELDTTTNQWSLFYKKS